MKADVLRPILLVRRFDECFRFYRDVMGFDVAWGQEGGSYASFIAGEGYHLSIFDRSEMAKVTGNKGSSPDPSSLDIVAVTFAVKDVRSVAIDLKSKGAHFITPLIDKRDWGVRTAFLRDPDGNLLQIESELDEKEWTQELREESRAYRKND